MAGTFLDRVHNDVAFDQVLSRVQRLPGMDPTLAFSETAPGFLADITTIGGPWPGRDEIRYAIDGKSDIGLAIGDDERARIGGVSEKHIVAKRGFEIAGVSQKVWQKDYLYGGMTQEMATRKALLPLRSFNERVSKSLFDVATSGDYSGSPTSNFRWSALSQDGQTVQADIVSQTANQVADVFANETQTILWPLRNGGETAINHDHVIDTNTAWTVATAAPIRDTILEHPGMGRVKAYVGATVIAAVRAAATAAYGAIRERLPFITGGDVKGADFAAPNDASIMMDSVEYIYVTDMPTNTAVYVASNQKPLHLNIGNVGGDGTNVDTGSWVERGNPETQGTRFGFRKTVSMGVSNPMAIAVAEHAA